MRIAIAGAGGVGAQLAVLLARAGADAAILARGAHLEAIRAHGLELRTPSATLRAQPSRATDDPAAIGPVDLVIVAVKAQHLDGLALEPMIGPETALLPFLNGVEATARLDARYGAGRSLVGVARISAFIESPGVVVQHSDFGRFEIGAAPPAPAQAAERAVAALAAAGVTVKRAPEPLRALWVKFLFLTALSGVTAGARCDLAALRADPRLKRLFRTLAEEAAAVARTEGAGITQADVEAAVETLSALPGQMRASMAHDLAAGKPLEVDWLSGAVSRLGAARGVETPASDAIWAALRPFANGA